jgi:hypothetical protein
LAHTFKGKEVAIIHNGDFSGDVSIVKELPGQKHAMEMKLPFEDLLDFVAEYVRGEAIEKLEGMDSRDLLLKILK